jgi:hypothetical protein
MGVRNFELLNVDRLLCFERDLMEQGVSLSQVKLVPVDIMITPYHIRILLAEGGRNV